MFNLGDYFNIKVSKVPGKTFEADIAYEKLCKHFKTHSLENFGIKLGDISAMASGALLEYLSQTQKNSLSHILEINNYITDEFMFLDVSSRRNLELTETLRDKKRKGSLLWVLDHTKTAMGARLLRKWITQPLISKQEIVKRLDAVESFKKDVLLREEIREILASVYDIERLMARIIYGTANARDLSALKSSIQYLPALKTLLKNCDAPMHEEILNTLDELADIFLIIDSAIVEEPPFSVREGGMIKPTYNDELAKLYEAKNEGAGWIADMERDEREKSGIKNLKIRFNKVFGYYIEISKSHLNNVPENYIRKQTLVNCERFYTVELKEIEETVLGAESRIVQLEFDTLKTLKAAIASQVYRIQTTANLIATIDVLQSLAAAADMHGYVKPEITTDGVLDIKDGRHPVVEKINDQFIPNDTYLDLEDDRLAIITGPNMAGKSTYMRQVALIVLMAHVGSFVPASQASVCVVDRIFTRVGASDDLATGQSTFMVEMMEVANILENATANSLIILDEIGRGTSTFDGLSIAWAVLEYIVKKEYIGAKTLFATHYHELTEIEARLPGVRNYCISTLEQQGDIIFLRKIKRGGANDSYGIHVAKLAGLPDIVVNRSNQILQTLADSSIAKSAKKPASSDNNHNVVYYNKNILEEDE